MQQCGQDTLRGSKQATAFVIGVEASVGVPPHRAVHLQGARLGWLRWCSSNNSAGDIRDGREEGGRFGLGNQAHRLRCELEHLERTARGSLKGVSLPKVEVEAPLTLDE